MLSHTVLLVVGGALLTGLLGALVFGSSGTAEERRIRDQQKLLRALEAQRRIRDAQLLRQAKHQRQPYREAPPPPRVEPEPEPEPEPVLITQSIEAREPDHRAARRQRKRDEKEQAAALKSAREAARHAQRQVEQERKSAVKAEQATRAAAERHQKDEARAAHRAAEAERAAAVKAQRDAEARELAAQPEAAPTQVAGEIADRPLSELPLFSWATRIETEDRDAAP